MTMLSRRDEILFKVHTRIATEGICLEYVFGHGTEPPWAYTIGLLMVGHPEVIVFGLPRCCTSYSLSNLFDEISEGVVRPVGRDRKQPNLGDPGLPVRLVPVPDHHWDCSEDRLCVAVEYYRAIGRARSELEALQLVWASKRGTFPWQPGATKRDKQRQPLLDRGLRSM